METVGINILFINDVVQFLHIFYLPLLLIQFSVIKVLSNRHLTVFVFGTVDTSKGWDRQVCPHAIGASTHIIRRYIVCLSPQLHTSVWESFSIFIMARHRHFCTLSRFKLLQVDQGSSVPLAKCSFGMILLSSHASTHVYKLAYVRVFPLALIKMLILILKNSINTRSFNI